MIFFRLMMICLLVHLVGCKDDEGQYTLYSTTASLLTNQIEERARIHIATFDAEHGGDYNRANCSFAEELFTAAQPHNKIFSVKGIQLKYWCEKGPYKK